MTQLILYSTSHCHLCEKAEAQLLNVQKQHDICWVTQEISTDDQLLEQYGTKIPVIKSIKNQSELNWPFSEDDIVMLIKT